MKEMSIFGMGNNQKGKAGFACQEQSKGGKQRIAAFQALVYFINQPFFLPSGIMESQVRLVVVGLADSLLDRILFLRPLLVLATCLVVLHELVGWFAQGARQMLQRLALLGPGHMFASGPLRLKSVIYRAVAIVCLVLVLVAEMRHWLLVFLPGWVTKPHALFHAVLAAILCHLLDTLLLVVLATLVVSRLPWRSLARRWLLGRVHAQWMLFQLEWDHRVKVRKSKAAPDERLQDMIYWPIHGGQYTNLSYAGLVYSLAIADVSSIDRQRRMQLVRREKLRWHPDKVLPQLAKANGIDPAVIGATQAAARSARERQLQQVALAVNQVFAFYDALYELRDGDFVQIYTFLHARCQTEWDFGQSHGNSMSTAVLGDAGLVNMCGHMRKAASQAGACWQDCKHKCCIKARGG
jgi:hypothetical protein